MWHDKITLHYMFQSGKLCHTRVHERVQVQKPEPAVVLHRHLGRPKSLIVFIFILAKCVISVFLFFHNL